MKDIKQIAKRLLKDESGQGATEYILLLVAVVAVAVIFKRQLWDIVNSKLGAISSKISDFGFDQQ